RGRSTAPIGLPVTYPSETQKVKNWFHVDQARASDDFACVSAYAPNAARRLRASTLDRRMSRGAQSRWWARAVVTCSRSRRYAACVFCESLRGRRARKNSSIAAYSESPIVTIASQAKAHIPGGGSFDT